ncbi:MAG: hypothetical protein LBU27_09775 [Candidatus Peribacteria bacterium]|jgi:UDP-N-acetylmuramyl tripeptide synthase|nr:hypothetical protein [Candidatus Peribacteria bacterium]
MELFAKGILKKNTSVKKILYRKDAMKTAIDEANAGDVVVIIVNNREHKKKCVNGKGIR